MSEQKSAGIVGAEQNATDKSLRHVEADVLISRLIRKKAHEVCFEPYVRGTVHVGHTSHSPALIRIDTQRQCSVQ